jgi:hypothetical protein
MRRKRWPHARSEKKRKLKEIKLGVFGWYASNDPCLRDQAVYLPSLDTIVLRRFINSDTGR